MSGNAEGKGVNSLRKKTLLLLHLAGMEVEDIFEDIFDSELERDQDLYTVCFLCLIIISSAKKYSI